MTLQNRVMPDGAIVALAARGTLMGNRGILHDDTKTLGRARWTHRNWVCCELAFKGRTRELMRAGGYYTELFFLDEAVALAAGHRPCGECRRADHLAFRAAWGRAFGAQVPAAEMDKVLHAGRVIPRKRLHATYHEQLAKLPEGTFIRDSQNSYLVRADHLLLFTPDGYSAAQTRAGDAFVTVLTPMPMVAVLAAGYRPRLHQSAQ